MCPKIPSSQTVKNICSTDGSWRIKFFSVHRAHTNREKKNPKEIAANNINRQVRENKKTVKVNFLF